MRSRFLLLTIGLFAFGMSPALAGLTVVRGEGRAVISGNDLAGARKAALADALYDAAGKLGSRVRGVSRLNQGVLREESTATVDGRFKTYSVVREGREGSAFVVSIEAVGETEGETCGGKRTDLDIRAISYRVAPGIPGQVQRNVEEGISRGLQLLSEGESFRVADQRHLPRIRGGERNNSSQYDYAAQLTDSRPSPAGYSLSGEVLVQRERRDNLVANVTDIVLTAVLSLHDNYTGARIGTIRRSVSFAERRTVFGMDEAFSMGRSRVDTGALFELIRADLEEKLACQPLRAAVLQSGKDEVMLSVGLEHGVNRGDYFLVGTANSRGEWQIVRVEEVTPSQSVAKVLKPRPSIPANALATLMR